MTEKPLESYDIGDTKEQGAGCLQHSDPSNHSDPDKEDRAMADDSQYTDSARADNPQKCDNWRGIGELARALAEKAGGAK